MSDVTPAETGRRVIELARAGDFAAVENLFAAPLKAAVSAELVRTAWLSEIARCGAVTEVADPTSESVADDLTRLAFTVVCTRGSFLVVMSVDGHGLLQGLRLAAASEEGWAHPRYAKPRRFGEEEFELGPAEYRTSGTLTLPRGKGPHRAVILLSGGGPFDRDETAGNNKVLKDLAWGLASRGIAALRYDKPTFANAGLIQSPRFTMSDEYLPNARHAIELLRRDSRIDSTHIFVAGHSMGGKIAPLVAERHPDLAGVIVLAGDTQPMHKAAVRVAEYLASLSGTTMPADAVEGVRRQAANVESDQLSSDTPSTDLPFGFSGAYWLDIKNYDPVATARKLSTPILILQGGRDYQVTVADDLRGWRDGLSDRPAVTVVVIPDDDHLFFRGAGPSTPDGYTAAQHVDPVVIKRIAAWVKKLR